ncbi:MAG: endonuclease NucS [Oscillospiraceae bacterium]|nr:endonuclease NucS [Oscillospiraceae bacterium]
MTVWEMVKKAVEDVTCQSENPVVAEKQIKEYILNHYPGTNPATIINQIMFCSVNRQSRVNDPKNQRQIICNREFDFLYRPNINTPEVVMYNPNEHGQWEIALSNDAKFIVRRTDDETIITDHGIAENNDLAFALEAHLRDFISKNLSTIGNLTLFENGVEYSTDVGNIDILTKNENDEFVVIELKLHRGEDAALGQVQRYMGWIKENLADNGNVYGMIIGKSITKKLKYAVSVAQNITLFEYSMTFSVAEAMLS